MSSQRESRSSDADRSWLSAAADGDASALGRLAGCWRDDAQARADWHCHHLIGDVLRSSELARPAARDAAFLQSLRVRLAAEPVVLAPVAAVAAAPRRAASRWAMPAAVAAGFVVVAGVLVVARTSGPMGTNDVMAAASSPGGLLNVSAAGRAQGPASADGAKLLRDARVDELLRMHQATRGGMAVPGSTLRQVDNVVMVEPAR